MTQSALSARSLFVVLAAGAGTRYRGATHKLNARFGHSTVAGTAIQAALDAAGSSTSADVAVVVGATKLTHLQPEVAVIANDDWEQGQATSLRHAVDYARTGGYGAVVVALADQPFITPQSWRAVAASAAPIAVADYNGERGHPIRLARKVWDLLPSTGDRGARSVIEQRQELVERVACEGSARDIDTLEDLRSWQNSSSTNSP